MTDTTIPPATSSDPSRTGTPYGRWRFRDRADLVDHIAKSLGITPTPSGGILLRSKDLRGKALPAPTQSRRLQFNDAILDLITSPDGLLEIDGVIHDLREARLRDRAGSFAPARALACAPDFGSGFERCESEDGSTIIFRSGDDSITFRAFSDSTLGFWKMGAEITTQGPDFEAAQIDSRYFFTAVGQTCAAISDADSDLNDDYLDEYESGTPFLSERPIRVASLCRAQWKNRRIAGIVSKGSSCFVVSVEPFPDGFPEDWPPLQTDPGGAVTVSPRALTLNSRPSRPTATKTIHISNTHPEPKQVTVGAIEVLPVEGPLQPSAQGSFTNTTGTFTVPPDGSVQTTVSFTGQSGFGSLQARVPVSWDGLGLTVAVTGTIQQVIGP